MSSFAQGRLATVFGFIEYQNAGKFTADQKLQIGKAVVRQLPVAHLRRLRLDINEELEARKENASGAPAKSDGD